MVSVVRTRVLPAEVETSKIGRPIVELLPPGAALSSSRTVEITKPDGENILFWGDDRGRVYWEQRQKGAAFVNIMDQDHDGTADVVVIGLHGGRVTRFERDPTLPRVDQPSVPPPVQPNPVLEDAFFNVRRLPRLPHRIVSPLGSGIEAHRTEDLDRVSEMLVRISAQVPVLAEVASRVPIRVAAPGEPVRSVCRVFVDDDTAAFYDYLRPSIGLRSDADDVTLTHELIHAAWTALITRDDSFALYRMSREMRRGPRAQEFDDIGELVAYFGAFHLAGYGPLFENELPELHAWLVGKLGSGRIHTGLTDEYAASVVRGVLALFRGEA